MQYNHVPVSFKQDIMISSIICIFIQRIFPSNCILCVVTLLTTASFLEVISELCGYSAATSLLTPFEVQSEVIVTFVSHFSLFLVGPVLTLSPGCISRCSVDEGLPQLSITAQGKEHHFCFD